MFFPRQCLHDGVFTFAAKELVAGRNGARGGGTPPSFRRSRCGFARIPLRCFDAPAVVSREFPCVSTLPLWFRANSGLLWPALASFAVAPAHAVGRDLRFDSRCGFARIPLRFDAPAVVSREFPCVSTLPLRIRENSVAFRCSRCGFARFPASSGLLWPLLGARLGCWPQRRTRWGVYNSFRRSRCGLIPSRFGAPAVVSHEFPCVSTLPLWFRANSGLLWPLLGGGCLGCGPQWRTRWGYCDEYKETSCTYCINVAIPPPAAAARLFVLPLLRLLPLLPLTPPPLPALHHLRSDVL